MELPTAPESRHITFLQEGKSPSVALMSRNENIYGMVVRQFYRSDMLYISWFGWFGHPIFSLRDINASLGLLPSYPEIRITISFAEFKMSTLYTFPDQVFFEILLSSAYSFAVLCSSCQFIVISAFSNFPSTGF